MKSAFIRSATMIAAILVIAYGLLTTSPVSDINPREQWLTWLLALAAVFLLLTMTFWPRISRTADIQGRGIVRCMALFAMVFILVSVQLLRIQFVDRGDILSHTAIAKDGSVVVNRRELIEAMNIARGRIFSSDGQIVADTVPQEVGGYERVYPAPVASYVVGYYSPLVYGASNLEAAYDAQLSGREGGNPIVEWLDEVLHRQKRGYDLTLSLDLRLQQKADELLSDRRGAVILMDAKTGAVRAMVSKPNYDPGPLYANTGPKAQEHIARANEYWQQLKNMDGSPLVFRPTQGMYVPGSTFKAVTAAAALDSGMAKPDSVYRDEGSLVVDSHVIEERNLPDDGRVAFSLTEAFGYSLNVVFAQIGLQLGAERLADYAHRFGFGEAIPFDFAVQPSQVANQPEFLSNQAGLADTAFGQGQLLATPLQMALVAQAIANDGNMMRPYLVERISTYEGESLLHRSAKEWREPVSTEPARQMREIMIQSVERGYAQTARIPGYVVGGKTGTAEVGGRSPHAWFIGFAGKDDPQYVVAVVVEYGGSGNSVALPIGRDLLRSALEMTQE